MLQHTEVNIVPMLQQTADTYPYMNIFLKEIFFESVFLLFFLTNLFFLYKKAKEFLYVLFIKVVFRYLKKQSRLLFR